MWKRVAAFGLRKEKYIKRLTQFYDCDTLKGIVL